MQITWIASYPRSGSTWMRFIFTGLCYGVDQLHLANRYVPSRAKDVTDQRFTKTHRGKPFKNKRVVYLVRHPVDVCASAYNFSLLKNNGHTPSDMVKEFLKYGGTKKWSRKGFGGWSEHVERWFASNNDMIVVHYEDLCDHPVREMTRISKHIGGTHSPVEVAEATAANAMRTIEENGIKEKGPVFYKPERKAQYEAGRRFITRATYGRAGEVFTDRQIEKLCDHFGPTLKALKYRAVY